MVITLSRCERASCDTGVQPSDTVTLRVSSSPAAVCTVGCAVVKAERSQPVTVTGVSTWVLVGVVKVGAVTSTACTVMLSVTEHPRLSVAVTPTL